MSQTNHTYREILQQPQMWMDEYGLLSEKKKEIESFVSKYIAGGYQLVYAGAGSSAFIGNILEVALANTSFAGGISVPTTDIITNPHAYFTPDKKVLLVSFARSGNSPESIGAINIVNDICRNVAHIYITCNAEGELARTADKDNTLLLLLPPETNDKSLAMTSSFSTMLFTCMVIANIADVEGQKSAVEALVKCGADTLARYDADLKLIGDKKFDRAVFLGSGELKGIAEESRLKLQELTDGAVVCNYDSFLGFRHGPKAVINENTALVYLLSGDPEIRRYEIDLVQQINSNNRVVAQVVVSQEKVVIPGVEPDLEIVLGNGMAQGVYSAIPYIIPAQLLGYYKSLGLGLNPDTPSVSGNIARVVEGVKIYYKAE